MQYRSADSVLIEVLEEVNTKCCMRLDLGGRKPVLCRMHTNYQNSLIFYQDLLEDS